MWNPWAYKKLSKSVQVWSSRFALKRSAGRYWSALRRIKTILFSMCGPSCSAVSFDLSSPVLPPITQSPSTIPTTSMPLTPTISPTSSSTASSSSSGKASSALLLWCLLRGSLDFPSKLEQIWKPWKCVVFSIQLLHWNFWWINSWTWWRWCSVVLYVWLH